MKLTLTLFAGRFRRHRCRCCYSYHYLKGLLGYVWAYSYPITKPKAAQQLRKIASLRCFTLHIMAQMVWS